MMIILFFIKLYSIFFSVAILWSLTTSEEFDSKTRKASLIVFVPIIISLIFGG